jgi:hypothetical protein
MLRRHVHQVGNSRGAAVHGTRGFISFPLKLPSLRSATLAAVSPPWVQGRVMEYRMLKVEGVISCLAARQSLCPLGLLLLLWAAIVRYARVGAIAPTAIKSAKREAAWQARGCSRTHERCCTTRDGSRFEDTKHTSGCQAV